VSSRGQTQRQLTHHRHQAALYRDVLFPPLVRVSLLARRLVLQARCPKGKVFPRGHPFPARLTATGAASPAETEARGRADRTACPVPFASPCLCCCVCLSVCPRASISGSPQGRRTAVFLLRAMRGTSQPRQCARRADVENFMHDVWGDQTNSISQAPWRLPPRRRFDEQQPEQRRSQR
jgi:hypothetical protein